MEDIKPAEINTTIPEAKVPETSAPVEETQEQINWKKFREARAQERKEKIEAEKRAQQKEEEVSALKAAMEALVNKPESNSRQISPDSEESEEERIARLVQQSVEKERRKDQEERARREQAEFPQRLTQTYADFDKVCTTENLDYLEYHYPEIAGAFKELPDTYDKWSKVYQAVKRFIPNPDHKKDKDRAEKNMMKPQSMSVSGKTQVGDTAPHSVDDKRKADNWTRMQRVMRNTT